MMNTRLAVAIHILTLIELANIKDIPTTSENLALSVNTNPVVVRRIIAMLKKAKLVNAKAGVAGTTLARKPEDITWLDVYHAVNTNEDTALFNTHENPNKNCYVGAYILDVIEEPLRAAQKAMEDKLSTYTLLDTIIPIAEKNNLKLR